MRDPPPHPDLKIGQSVLAFVSTTKVLGVWLQNDLKKVNGTPKRTT